MPLVFLTKRPLCNRARGSKHCFSSQSFFLSSLPIERGGKTCPEKPSCGKQNTHTSQQEFPPGRRGSKRQCCSYQEEERATYHHQEKVLVFHTLIHGSKVAKE